MKLAVLMLFIACPKGNLRHVSGGLICSVFLFCCRFCSLTLIKSESTRIAYEFYAGVCFPIICFKCFKKQAGKEITHTDTHMQSDFNAECCVLTHGSFPHKNWSPWIFPLAFQNRGGCRSFSLAQSALGAVQEPPTERGPKFVVYAEVPKTSDFRFGCLHRWR